MAHDRQVSSYHRDVLGTHRESWLSTLQQPQLHLAQLYRGGDFLADSVATFLAAGLARGDTALVIAEPANCEAFAHALARRGIDRSRVIVRDAAETLALIMRDDKPDPERFDRVIGELVRGVSSVCAYGEMVALLWREGRAEAAVALEQLWDRLAHGTRLSLLCGYPLDVLGTAHEHFDSVCLAHAHVLPSEDFLGLGEIEQLAYVARLEQNARVLGAQQAMLQSIVDSSEDCIKMLDLDARLLFMSKGGMLKLEICDFVPIYGANWLSFWDGEDRIAATAAVEKAKAGGVGDFVGFFPLTQSKAPRWWHVVVNPIRDNDGRISRILAVSRDVTELRRLESELRASLEARDQFLSIASHELRTPITSLALQVDMLAQLLERDAPIPPEKLAKLLELSRRQVKRLTVLVESMLGVSAIRAGKLAFVPERANLSDLVRTVTERARAQIAAAGCELSLDLAADAEGHWDPGRLEQVIDNLLGNALKYAPRTPIHVRTVRDGECVRLVVSDRGPGIAVEQQATIFERFERAPSARSVGGLGLGLFIAKQLVEAHGGTIRVDSRPDEGASFVVELPVVGAR